MPTCWRMKSVLHRNQQSCICLPLQIYARFGTPFSMPVDELIWADFALLLSQLSTNPSLLVLESTVKCTLYHIRGSTQYLRLGWKCCDSAHSTFTLMMIMMSFIFLAFSWLTSNTFLTLFVYICAHVTWTMTISCQYVVLTKIKLLRKPVQNSRT